MICVLAALAVSSSETAPSQSSRATARPKTKADIDRLMTELSNWGRWGKDDQLGTMNLITPEKRRQAYSLVKEGVTVSLARPVEKTVAADNPAPFIQKMTLTGLNNPDSLRLTPTPFRITDTPTPTWIHWDTCFITASCTTAFPRRQ